MATRLLEIPAPIIEAAIAGEQAEENLILDRELLFLTPLYRAEFGCASHIQRLLRGLPPRGAIDPEKALPWVEAQTGLALAPSQRAAVAAMLANKVYVITGAVRVWARPPWPTPALAGPPSFNAIRNQGRHPTSTPL